MTLTPVPADNPDDLYPPPLDVIGGIGALLTGGFLSLAGWNAFFNSVVAVGAPTALWWVQLATAVIFGLGVATVLTLLVTPAALAAILVHARKRAA